MEFLNIFLPILLYILGAVLLLSLIILVVKLIDTVDKTNLLLDDTKKKIESLNGVFNIIDTVTDSMSLISDKIVETVFNLIGKIFNKKKKEGNE
ncbi:MAG: hypothetical protein RR359_02145 [Bacilli bacterium]